MEQLARHPRVLLATLVAAGLLLAGCSGGDDDPSPEGTSTSAAPTTAATPTPTGDVPPLSEEEQAAGDVIDRFLAAVAGADAAGAYALLSDRSKTAIGDPAAFAALGAELAGRFGAFAGGDVTREVMTVSEGVVVVTLSATTTQAGQTSAAAYAVPVRLDEADGRLEIVPPDALGAAVLEIPDPAQPAAVLAADSELAATVPAGSETYLAAIDGNDAPVEVQPADGDRLRLVALPQLAPGVHRVTFATIREDGTAIAVAGAFTTG